MLRSPASTVPRFWRTRLLWRCTSKPATRAAPLVGSSRVHNMRMVVDLPAPLGPSRPNTSPRGTCKLTPATAVNQRGVFYRRDPLLNELLDQIVGFNCLVRHSDNVGRGVQV